MTSRRLAGVLLAAGLTVLGASEAGAAGWKAGAAKVAITPDRPTWMAGYGARDRPSEGAVHDLWAKALWLVDPDGNKSLVVTLDLCGIDRGFSLGVREVVEATYHVPRARIVLASSHTHCGPVVGECLITMYPMNEEQTKVVKDYSVQLKGLILRAVEDAHRRIEPADAAWGTGRADFAVNRRNNKEGDVPALRARNALEGPTDPDVPVLRVRGADGKVKAVVFGYACHCTVLSFNKFSGDYAGFAQTDLEEAYPGATALFVAGCGADQNPLPRRTVELAQKYGGQLAKAVRQVVDGAMAPLHGPLTAEYQEIPLKFGTPPTRAELEKESQSKTFSQASRARKLLADLDRHGSLPTTYPYPLQVWKCGDLTWVLLGGEVVVDYSLRLKRNLGASHTWVSSYCNDVMAYIPSHRVLKEGGYEGATSMIPYGQPTVWSTEVENQIFDGLNGLLKEKAAP